MRHIISVLVDNEAGALVRVAGLFSARGYNIESLTVAPTDDATLSRMTIVTDGADIDQVSKQLNKLVEVVHQDDLTDDVHIEREMMMIKVSAKGAQREEIMRLSNIFRGRIINVTESTYIIELTGAGDKLDAFINAVGRAHIVEVVRSGVLGIGRGDLGLNLSKLS